MPNYDLTIPATEPGSGDEQGMPLGEIEDACRAARQAGGKDSTAVKVKVNRNGRVQEMRPQLRPGDSDRTAPLGGPAVESASL